jgi:hypothetical protein
MILILSERHSEINMKNGNPKITEPNQALQRMNTLVTDHAPSSMLRAKRVHR